VQAATIAGNPPNVFVLDVGVTSMMAMNGLMEPLDARVAADKPGTSVFSSPSFKSCKYSGKLYGCLHVLEPLPVL